MDQLACAYGGIIGIDFKHQVPKIQEVSCSFEEKGYRLVIVDTGETMPTLPTVRLRSDRDARRRLLL